MVEAVTERTRKLVRYAHLIHSFGISRGSCKFLFNLGRKRANFDRNLQFADKRHGNK